MTIWKFRHRHLGISIGIHVGIGIGIVKFWSLKLFEALIFAFQSFLLIKTSMVKSFSNTLSSFPESVCCCLEQLFCRDVVSACFWRKELRHGRYLRNFKNTQDWKLRLVCLCISDKDRVGKHKSFRYFTKKWLHYRRSHSIFENSRSMQRKQLRWTQFPLQL